MRKKKILWTIVIWFAILQMLSPLIHAHVEADQPDQGRGLHVHAQDLFQTQDDVTRSYGIVTNIHTVSIDKALVKSLDLMQLPLFVLLFIIASVTLALQSLRCQFTASTFLPLYLRPQLTPRAPPLY